MKIDVIIPHYKETEKTILQALSSINNQVGVSNIELGAIVVTDCEGYAFDEAEQILIQAALKLPVRFLNARCHGTGLVRQYALNNSNADYVMFCDSDDILASPFVLKYFVDTIKENPDIEVIYTSYLEEMYNGEYRYEQKDDDVSITTLHGKIYNRQFLVDNKIEFPDFMISEDGAFNFKVICHAKKAIFNDDIITYIWKYNPKSLTRENTPFADFAVNIRSFTESIKAFETFFDETINSSTSQVNTKVIEPFINSLYFRLNMITQIPNLTDEMKAEANKTKIRLDECKKKYERYFND